MLTSNTQACIFISTEQVKSILHLLLDESKLASRDLEWWVLLSH